MNLKKHTIPQLLALWGKANKDIAAGIFIKACVWVELKERGHDMSELTDPATRFYPDVAAGRLAPEMVLIYDGAPAVLAKVATLLPEEQAVLATGDGRVQVIETANSEPKSLLLSALPVRRLDQVIDSKTGTIRTPAQQRRHVAPPRASQNIRRAPQTDDSDWDVRKTLTLAECNELTDVAEKAGRTPAEHIRWALFRFGVIKQAKRATTAKRPAGRPSAHP